MRVVLGPVVERPSFHVRNRPFERGPLERVSEGSVGVLNRELDVIGRGGEPKTVDGLRLGGAGKPVNPVPSRPDGRRYVVPRPVVRDSERMSARSKVRPNRDKVYQFNVRSGDDLEMRRRPSRVDYEFHVQRSGAGQQLVDGCGGCRKRPASAVALGDREELSAVPCQLVDRRIVVGRVWKRAQSSGVPRDVGKVVDDACSLVV